MSGLLALLWFYLEFRTGFLNATFLSSVFPVFLAVEIYVLVALTRSEGRASVLLFLTFIASLFLWIQTVLATIWMVGRGRGAEWFDGHGYWSERHGF